MAKLYFKIASDWEEVVRLRNEIARLKQELKNMDGTQSPATFKTLNTQLAASTQRMNELVNEAAKAGAVMEGDFKKKIFDASQSVNDFTEKIIAQKNTIKGFEQTLRAMQEEYRNITKNGGRGQDRLDSIHRMKNIIAEEKDALFNLTQQQANARLSVSKLRQEYALYKDDSVKVVSANDDIVGSMKQFILTIAGADAIKSFISNVVEVTGNFQKMEAVLGNTLGSTSKAKETMDMLADFGAKTPFQVDELTAAYVKLANQGFTPTMSQMKKLGDLASSTGKSFDQLAEAIIDAQVGENERLKEFGIRASKNGDKVTYTFKEQETTVQNTASAIREYILSLGDLEGVVGANEKISATFVGRLSNIQDELTNQFKNFGDQFNSELSGGINAAALLVENLNSIIPVIGGLVTAYGAYKAAVIAVNAAHKAGALFENIRLIGMMRKELGLATAAQQAFNTASKANIYATLISVLIGLGTAVYMFTKRTNEATEANNSLNKVSRNASEEYAKQASSIDRLTGFLKSETASLTLKREKLKELKGLIPGYNAELNEEGKLVNNNTEAIKAYLTQLEKQIKLKAAQEELEELYRKKRLQEKDIKAKQEYAEREKNKVPGVVYGGDLGIEAQRQALSRAADAENALKQANSELKITETNIEQIQKEIEDTSLSTPKDKSVETQNKAYWEKQKKDAETQLEALSDIEANGKKGLALKQKIRQYEKKIKAYSSKETTPNTNSIISQNEKIAEIERKQAIDRQRQYEDLETQLAQSRIDAMENGYEKEQAQRELNNKKEIQSLQRQKQDYIHAYTQAQKELFDAQEELKAKKDSKYKRKTFDSSSVSVDTTAFDAVIENISQRQLNDKIREQEESWNDYLIKFGNYQQKRKALIEKYDKEIIEAKTAGEVAILEKEKGNSLDDLDNSVKNSATLMGQLFADASQKSANEIQKIIDKAELLMQYLGTVKDEQGNVPIGGKTVSKKDILDLGISDNTLQNLEMSTEEVEALRNAIDKLKGDLGTKSPFKLFETQIKSAIDKISQGGKKNIAQGITEIGTSITSFAPVISQLGQDFGNIFGDDEFGDKISGVADALGGLGQTAAGVGQIMAGDIVGGAMSAVSGISSIVSAFDGLFGANYDKYNKAKEEYESYISVLDDVIEKQKEMVASLDNQNAVNTYDYAKSLIEKSAEAARILGKERLNSGASAGSHSIGIRIRKGMSSEGWSEAEKALGAVFNKATEGRMTGLFDLSVEQLEKLQVEAPTFWAKLDDDVRTYLEDIIAANESAEDLKDTLNESLTGISFDSLFDNFLESLYDMESSVEDTSDDMADYLRKSLIKSFAVENYKDKMKEWYNKWAEAMKDGQISSEEQKSLDDLKNSIITGATESVKLINDQFDYLKKDSSQSSTKGGFQIMSQDTGNELNGRFTALQMSGEEIKAQNVQQTQSLNILTVRVDAILSVNTETRNIADEIRTIQVNSYLELQEIRQNTGDTVKQLKLMDEKLKKIENNTNKL